MGKQVYWRYIIRYWINERDLDTYEYYTGYTGRDPITRFKEHLGGKCTHTKKYPFLQLVYHEKLITTKAQVREREKYIKHLSKQKKEELIKKMPRTKGTGKMRNKLYDLDDLVSCKINQYQKRYLNTKENVSEHIRNLINFGMWLRSKGGGLFSRLFILCSQLSDKYGEEDSEEFNEILDILNTIAGRINPL